MEHMNERWVAYEYEVRTAGGKFVCSVGAFPDDMTGVLTAKAICDAHNAALDAAPAPKADAPASVAQVGAAGCVPAGITLRQWYAGQALASMSVAPDYSTGHCNAEMVRRAFILADAMLAAEKGGEA